MHKYKAIQLDDLAHVHNAHVRRSTDFGLWLRQYLEDRRQAERHKQARAHVMNTIVSLVAPSRRQAI
jgi:hypothetical protein